MSSAEAGPASHSGSGERAERSFLLVLTAAITVLFLVMIRQFLLPVILGATFSVLAHPLRAVLLRWCGGRKVWAALGTLLVAALIVGIPALAFLGLVTRQALEISQAAGPWIEIQMSDMSDLDRRLRLVAGLEGLLPSRERIVAVVSDAASGAGSFLVGRFALATRGAASVVLDVFVLLYATFFFLADGRQVLNRILFYIPMDPVDEARLLDKFVSVTRATLKGSLLIALIQGALAGTAFGIAGIPGAALWGSVTAVASIIPPIGGAVVWLPIVAYLFLAGRTLAAVGLLLWCALVVSTVDNLLRPRFVGADTRMSDLLVLLSTLGGILLFGLSGVIVGPIVPALFVTVWHLYGETFGKWLPGGVSERHEPEVVVP